MQNKICDKHSHQSCQKELSTKLKFYTIGQLLLRSIYSIKTDVAESLNFYLLLQIVVSASHRETCIRIHRHIFFFIDCSTCYKFLQHCLIYARTFFDSFASICLFRMISETHKKRRFTDYSYRYWLNKVTCYLLSFKIILICLLLK